MVLRSLALTGRRFEAWSEIEQPMQRATDYWNTHKQPFVWRHRRRHRIHATSVSWQYQKSH